MSQAHRMKDFVGLKQKVNFLQNTDAYPQEIRNVQVKETHMSYVFLTDVYVFKMKKPVRLPYLDFSSLGKRKVDCHNEVELNQRLAPETYLDVLPLTYDKDRKLHINGPGKTVEWLVKMRRLDEDKMLQKLILKDEVPKDKLHKTADFLADFYRQSGPVEIDSFAYWNKLLDGVRTSYQVILDERYELPLNLIKEVVSVQQTFLTQKDTLFEQRVKQSKILEGHGDLRPAHICLEDKPVIFDCLEFNKELRTLDPLDELAFLDMECERIRNQEVGKVFLQVYAEKNEEEIEEELLLFYKSKRATLRAKLSLQHLEDEEYQDQDQWVNKAHDYLSLAKRYTDELSKIS